jgi:Domain of unknown function (DUF4062)
VRKRKKLQVFISSTFIDLRAERQAAVEAVLDAGHIPAGMELFTAGDESQLKIIHRWIDDSDVFMLILGGRYGSIETKSGKSYIHLEYDYAKKIKKPHFSVVMEQSMLEAKIKAHELGSKLVETDNGPKFKEFKAEVSSIMCAYFNSLDQLRLQTSRSLRDIDPEDKLSGWVHGSEVIDPKSIIDKLDLLEKENALLRSRVGVLDFDDSQESIMRIVSALDDESKEIIKSAKSADGRFMLVSLGPVSELLFGRNERRKIADPKDTERIKWKIDKLEKMDLLRCESQSGTTKNYSLRHLGHCIAGVL